MAKENDMSTPRLVDDKQSNSSKKQAMDFYDDLERILKLSGVSNYYYSIGKPDFYDALERILKLSGVPKYYYSIGKPSDGCVCIEQLGEKWIVYEMARGCKIHERIFDSAHLAGCDFFESVVADEVKLSVMKKQLEDCINYRLFQGKELAACFNSQTNKSIFIDYKALSIYVFDLLLLEYIKRKLIRELEYIADNVRLFNINDHMQDMINRKFFSNLEDRGLQSGEISSARLDKWVMYELRHLEDEYKNYHGDEIIQEISKYLRIFDETYSRDFRSVVTLLNKAYSINIIPLRLRNIYGIHYLYKYAIIPLVPLDEAIYKFDLGSVKEELDLDCVQEDIILGQLINQKMKDFLYEQRYLDTLSRERINYIIDESGNNIPVYSFFAVNSIKVITLIRLLYDKIEHNRREF